MNSTDQFLQSAVIQFRDDTPFSTEFDDFYFSSDYGPQETDYIYLQRNDLQRRWSSPAENKDTAFIIAETGFGTGLNFICAWHLWNALNINQRQLHYVAVEKHPVSKADLARALSRWPQLAGYTEALLAVYPPLSPGTHTVFPQVQTAQSTVKLTLIFNDASEALSTLHTHVDAWFLDGFTPSRNPDMWSEALFKEVARLSRPGSTFATFTSAGIVRRSLQSVGFKVEKQPGLGLKREMCFGTFVEQP
jgi:tRNA 5-methylaminomethyl-2-thiouridine biosynthesis bifunctional protein